MNRRQMLLGASLYAASSSILKANADTDDAETAASAAQIQSLGLEVLAEDASRQVLFENVKTAAIAEDSDSDIQTFDLTGPFSFPDDVDFDTHLNKPRTAIFGVDISHYTPRAFPIEKLRSKKVRFVYIKASQGLSAVDDKFAGFWKRAGDLKQPFEVLHRGAYHFLSCGDPADVGRAWGARQAQTFVKVVTANGGLKKTDMPPVVDLEWDVSSSNPDRWSRRKSDDILEVVSGFLETVKSELNVTPMIYTARSWWKGRIGKEAKISKLADFPLWGADYSKFSRASEDPKTIGGQKWALWQFSPEAKLASGFDGGFDVNIFKGSEDDFYNAFPVARFT